MKVRIYNCIVFLAFWAVLAVGLTGCHKKGGEPAESETESTTTAPPTGMGGLPGDQVPMSVEQLQSIRMLPPDVLASIGTKTDFPAQWVYPNAYYAKVLYPEKARQSVAASAIQELLDANAASLPFLSLCEKTDLILTSEKSSFVALNDTKSGMLLASDFPLPARAVYLHSQVPIDQKKIQDFVFAGVPADQIKQEKLGPHSVQLISQSVTVPVDQEQTRFAQAQSVTVSLAFPDPQSVVLVTGGPRDVSEYYSMGGDTDSRGVMAQCLARIPVTRAEFSFLYDYDHPLASMVPNIFPGQMGQEVATSGDFVFLGINVGAATDQDNIVTLVTDTKSEESVGKAQTALGGTLLLLADEAKKVAAMPNAGPGATMLQGLDNVLKRVQTETTGNRLTARIPWSQDTADYLLGALDKLNQSRRESERLMRYNNVAQQLSVVGGAMTSYFSKNNVYPSNIQAGDGTPLLSWRVALLPEFGPEGQALYDEFKLDEPWNSENNIKLLEKMPSLYRSPIDSTLGTKTTVERFNSPNTPFGQYSRDLTTQQLANPGKTFMVVSTVPARAVEWTQPEELVYDEARPESLVEAFGDYVVAAPFMGNVFRAPLSGSPEGLAILGAWVTGKTAPDAPQAPSADATAATPDQIAPDQTTSDQTAPAAEPAAEPVATEPVAAEPAAPAEAAVPAESVPVPGI